MSLVAGPNAPYRDKALPIDMRVHDLLARMTLAEKAALMFHVTTIIGPDGALTDAVADLGIADAEHLIGDLGITHLNLLGTAAEGRTTAEWHNRLQRRALDTRLGIPITLASDPRHHFTDNPLASAMAGAFSQWPEPIGLAALRSPDLVARFADIARQEYTAVGIRVAIHPQIDVATEPRWGRISATFGEDADLTSSLGVAYVRGLQGETVGPGSVAAMAKHFPGGGPQKDGEDPHFSYGREQVYPGGHFRYHLAPFQAAIRAGVAQIMPYYGMPVGTEYEEVAFGYNRGVITGLLREELGFDGIVCTDWGIVTDSALLGQTTPARAWGVEHLGVLDRIRRVIEAGCDQFGGEAMPDLVVRLVEEGLVGEDRIDISARRLLRQKFVLGLFDDPFVDPDRAESTVGNPVFVAEGASAQRRAYTLLTNPSDRLPLPAGLRVYAENVDTDLLTRYATVVASPDEADVALIRLKAPYEPRQGVFESLFHAGSLEFGAQEKARQSALYQQVPTVVDIYLDRPAAVPEVAAQAAALLGSYGSSDEAFLDVVFGGAEPEGALPFDLPSSTAAVAASHTDVPFDTAGPLFRFGHGLRYTREAIRDGGHPRPSVPNAAAPTPIDSAARISTPADVDGVWALTIQTPGGERPATLRLTSAGKTFTGELNGTAIANGQVDNNRISFKASLTEPFKLKITCDVTITGDHLTGTAKAALIPILLRFTGTRMSPA